MAIWNVNGLGRLKFMPKGTTISRECCIQTRSLKAVIRAQGRPVLLQQSSAPCGSVAQYAKKQTNKQTGGSEALLICHLKDLKK